MNASGRACISDFGLATVTRDNRATQREGPASGAHNTLWVAPETLTDARTSKEADVFSYGLVAIEVRPSDHQFFPRRPPCPDMERGVALESGYSSRSDGQDSTRRASNPT